MKRFDEQFRENVKKAFGAYNADHLADEGWNAFAGRGGGLRRRAALIPFWMRAASVALLIAAGGLIAYRLIVPPSGSGGSADDAGRAATVAHAMTDSGKDSSAGGAMSGRVAMDMEGAADTTGQDTGTVAAGATMIAGEAGKTDKTSVVRPAGKEREATTPADHPDSYGIRRAALTAGGHENALPAGTIAAAGRVAGIAPTTLSLHDAARTGEVSDNAGRITAGSSIPRERRHGTTTLMAGVSGLFVQGSGSTSSGSGLAAGLYLNQKLTRRLSFRPGLTLAMNAVGLENGDFFAGPQYSLPLNDGTTGVPHSYNARLNMLAMEVPLNLVFRVSGSERSGFFLSAGASTMIYINQNYTADVVTAFTKPVYDMSAGSFTEETRFSTVEVTNEYGHFSRADILGLANLSAGYSLPWGRGGSLLIEPFLQLPVSNLTDLNLKIRYGGISMKMQFGNMLPGK